MSKKKLINKCIIWLSYLIYLFLPTSINGNLFGTKYVIVKWTVAFLFLLILMIVNKINKNQFIIAMSMMIYLICVSLIAIIQFGSQFSLARVIPMMCLLMLFTIEFKDFVSQQDINKMIIISFIVMVILGLGVIIHQPTIGNFLINFYSQSYETATSNAIAKGRPVFTFGVYTRTAFFYMIFFYFMYNRVQNSKRNRYLIGCVICFILCLFLTSNSSVIYTIAMSLLFLWLLKGKPIQLSMLVGIMFLIIYRSASYLITMYQRAFSSKINGLFARYANGAPLYKENFNIIKNSFGLGFTISDNANYADSGWIQFLTMGSFLLMFVIYYLLYKSLKKNFEKSYLIIFAIIMSFEFVESGMWMDKFIFFYILYAHMINSNRQLQNTYNMRNYI